MKKPKLSAALKRQFSEGGRVVWNKGYGDYVSGEKNPNYGKHWNDDWKKRHSEFMKGRFTGSRNPNWKGGLLIYPNWTELKYATVNKSKNR